MGLKILITKWGIGGVWIIWQRETWQKPLPFSHGSEKSGLQSLKIYSLKGIRHGLIGHLI